MKKMIVMAVLGIGLANLSLAGENKPAFRNSASEVNLTLSQNVSLEDLSSVYQANKKEPTIAWTWGCLCPSSGHAYAGDWGRGAYFLAAKALVYGGTMVAYTQIPNSSMPNKQRAYSTSMAIGGVLSLVLMIWEPYDAMLTAEDYNKRLRKSLAIDIEPQADGMRMGFKINY